MKPDETSDGWVVLDLDGTLARGDVEACFVRFLAGSGFFRPSHYVGAAVTWPLNWILKKIGRSPVWRSWSRGLDVRAVEKLAKDFAGSGKMPQVNLGVQRYATASGARIMILTACAEPLAQAFLRHNDMHDTHVIGTRIDPKSWRAERVPYGRSKLRYLPRGRLACGVGNEYADRFFLARCETALIVAGDKKLEDLATKMSWQQIKED